MASVHAVRPVNAVPVYLRCFLCLINAGCRTLRFSGAPLALRMYLRRCGFLHSGYRIAQSRQGVRFVRLDSDDHALIQQHFDPEPKSGPQKTRLSLAQQPREQSFEQNSYLRIHLSKFDTHALTRHDVSDKPPMLNVLTRETCCWPLPYQVTDMPCGKEIRGWRRIPAMVLALIRHGKSTS